MASIRLMTNNPHKVEELESHGIEVASRIPIEVGHHEENLGYLRSKAERMAHLLRFRGQLPGNQECLFFDPLIDHLAMVSHHVHPRPFVTLAYAQSMDGVLLASEERGDVLPAVRYLSSHHDAMMTIATHFEGLIGCSDPSKRLILWDPELRVLEKGLDPEIGCEGVWVLTVPGHPIEQHRSIEARGVRVIVVTQSTDGVPEFGGVLEALAAVGVRTLLVAGNEALVSALLYNRLVDYCVMTLVAHFLGRHHFESGRASVLPEFTECAFHELSGDMVAFGPISYTHPG